MDALLDPIRDLLEGPIDFKGQQLAEVISQVLLVVTGVIALVVGYQAEDIYLTLWIGLAGALSTMLIVVPAWPVFNQDPEPWLPSAKSLAALPAGGIIVEQ